LLSKKVADFILFTQIVELLNWWIIKLIWLKKDYRKLLILEHRWTLVYQIFK
jgi:hypothetical protein